MSGPNRLKYLLGHVGEREVAQAAILRNHPEQLHDHPGHPEEAAVADHHGLGRPRGARGVDQAGARPGVEGGDARVEGGVAHRFARAQQLVPADDPRRLATSVEEDDGPEVGQAPAAREKGREVGLRFSTTTTAASQCRAMYSHCSGAEVV